MTLQPEALRRYAVPVAAPVAGVPLVKSTVNLGWMREIRKGRIDMPVGCSEDYRQKRLRWAFARFLEWQRKVDGAKFTGEFRIHGPFPHFEAQPNDVQTGDRGGTREVARNLAADTAEADREDYVFEVLFNVPEYVNEIRMDLASELFNRPGGRPGLKPLRAVDWRGHGGDRWSLNRR